jgi:hypothetical protein
MFGKLKDEGRPRDARLLSSPRGHDGRPGKARRRQGRPAPWFSRSYRFFPRLVVNSPRPRRRPDSRS